MVSPADFAGKKANIVKLSEEVITSSVPTPTVIPPTVKPLAEIKGDVVYDSTHCRFCDKEYIPKGYSNYAPPICSPECLGLYILYLELYSFPFTCKICLRQEIRTEPFYEEICGIGCIRTAIRENLVEIVLEEDGNLKPPTFLKTSLNECRKAVVKIVAANTQPKVLTTFSKLPKQILSNFDFKLIFSQRVLFFPLHNPEEENEPNSNTPLRGKTIHIPLLKNNHQLVEVVDEELLRKQEAYLAENYTERTFNPSKFKERVTQENLRKVRERQKQVHFQDFLCPNPYKKMYRTLEEANDFIKEHHPDDKELKPYKCRCGTLHIGHTAPKNITRNPRSKPKKITITPQTIRPDDTRTQSMKTIHQAANEKTEK